MAQDQPLNDKQHFQYGFVMLDVPTFNQAAVREAILNAVSHRDYRLPVLVFVRQYPRRLEVVSPGGFPPSVNYPRETSSGGRRRATGGLPKPLRAAAWSSERAKA